MGIKYVIRKVLRCEEYEESYTILQHGQGHLIQKKKLFKH